MEDKKSAYRIFVLFASVCFILSCSSHGSECEPTHIKNILLLYVDDLRPEINCYGSDGPITPNIDRLAERSTIFNKAYCQVSVCMPSRVSTLSGMYPRKVTQGLLRQLLPDGQASLPGYLTENGYDTVSIGKIYHSSRDDLESWTRKYPTMYNGKEYGGWCPGYQLQENIDKIPNFTYGPGRERGSKPPLLEFADAPDSAYPEGVFADEAIAELYSHSMSGKPLFLAVGFYRPHLPFTCPKKYWDMYRRENIEIAENQNLPRNAIGRNGWTDLIHYGDEVVNAMDVLRTDYTSESFPVLPKDKQQELIHGYLACVSFVDAQIGRILDALEESGMADETAVVLLGDNGFQLGEHRLWAKKTNYEESVRVPLIVAAPGYTEGQSSDALVELVDTYPTLCELVGLPVPEHVEGISMVPLLGNPLHEWKAAAFSIWDGSRSMRTERYRLTVYDHTIQEGSLFQLPGSEKYELYDYETDPEGNVNIAREPGSKSLLLELKSMMDGHPYIRSSD